MKILIIALPRTGSTSLLRKIAEDKNLREIFEPFRRNSRFLYTPNMENVVVKTIVEQHPDNFFLAMQFDEVILLSRRNYQDHLESLAYLYYNIPTGYNSGEHYEYTSPPKHITKLAASRITSMNKELEILSNRLNVPIQYYEDLFDENGPDKLRIKNSPKTMI